MTSSSFTLRVRGSNSSSTTDDVYENFQTFMNRRITGSDRIQQLSSNPFSNKDQIYSVPVTLQSTATTANVYLAVSDSLKGTNGLPNYYSPKQADNSYPVCGGLGSNPIASATDVKTSTTNIAGTCTYNGENYTVIRVNGSTPRNAGTFEFKLCFP
jgi:hypothetical protein